MSTEYVDNNYHTIPESGCWLWAGAWNRYGYGFINKHGKTSLAHRYFWSKHNGPIPDGMLVCHKCDTRPCVNPAHLFLGNHLANSLDMQRKGRKNHGSPRIGLNKTNKRSGW